ncbi:hypothetical protein [Cohnella sp.]|uniref:hypothetical protein n=1 Tax=Cohnella sp. TaxID=1883426 RepID=UPI00356B5A61
MPIELRVAHCPGCGNVFQKNARNLCSACSSVADEQMLSIERFLLRNRLATTEQTAEAVSLPPQQIRSWIRQGRIRVYEYPNLTDQCDLCSSSIRSGHLCYSCSNKIKDDITIALERERAMKERLRNASNYIAKG